MSLVTHTSFPFIAPAVLANGSIEEAFSWDEYTRGHDALLFFYPLDFTFVCPSELIALHKRMPAFHSKQIKVAAVSIDSVYTHLAWRNTAIHEGGIGPVDFPLISDLDHQIARHYGVQHPEASVALRSAIMIDQNGIVRAQLTYDLPLGRNIDELLRIFDAIEHHRRYGEVCPAGWHSGKNAMHATPEGVQQYLEQNEHIL